MSLIRLKLFPPSVSTAVDLPCNMGGSWAHRFLRGQTVRHAHTSHYLACLPLLSSSYSPLPRTLVHDVNTLVHDVNTTSTLRRQHYFLVISSLRSLLASPRPQGLRFFYEAAGVGSGFGSVIVASPPSFSAPSFAAVYVYRWCQPSRAHTHTHTHAHAHAQTHTRNEERDGMRARRSRPPAAAAAAAVSSAFLAATASSNSASTLTSLPSVRGTKGFVPAFMTQSYYGKWAC